MQRMLAGALIVSALMAGAAPARAQQAQQAEPSAWRAVRVAKWATVGTSVGAALYGFAYNQRADDAYEQLEAMCQADLLRCRARTAGGAYSDPVLEAEYQRIRDMDRQAGTGLVIAQAAVAASVVLFILDLRNDRPPPNIPFEPRSLELAPSRDGGIAIVARWYR